jgi:phospholipase C
MTRLRMIALWISLAATAGVLASLQACGGGSSTSSNPPPPPPPQKIQHVVVIFQENRTPDNLFQDRVLIANGADIQNYGIDSTGAKVLLQPTPFKTDYDINHSHASFLKMYDGGKMDGADKIPVFCNDPCVIPPPPLAQFQYVELSELRPYFALAETYTFGDRMFQTNQGPSFPAHQFIISGSSAPTPPNTANSNLFAADNPLGGGLTDPGNLTGCLAPPGEYVMLIDPANPDPNTNETQSSFPCYDHPTLTDLLDAQSLTWRYYAPSAGQLWNGPTGIQHICGPNPAPPNATACAGSIWQTHEVINPPQVLTDIQNGQLDSVTWVIPSGLASDHSGGTDGSGPAWVASIVNAIGNSQYWSNTAIIITWDDWGGWYDHVAPPILNSYEYGFRVPLIVVSPYAKAGYVSHTTHDFGSILNFIETVFSLSKVAPGVSPAYADELTSDDLSDCFDFTQTPLTFKTISSPMSAKYFIEDKRPPTDPDSD